jgi:hypothetical protein
MIPDFGKEFWQPVYARVADGTVYLAMENESPITQLNYGFSWYLDTDQSPQTGFAMFSIGADYLLEGGVLFKFAGANQGSWVWSVVGPGFLAWAALIFSIAPR